MSGRLPASIARNDVWGEDWPNVRAMWPLSPTVAYLNHGGFGAVPQLVLEEQQSWRDRMEVNPTRFFNRELPAALDEALAEVAQFFGVDHRSLAFVDNVTTALSAILASFPLEAGDELLVTDHAYGAVRIAADRWATSARARLATAHVPLFASDSDVAAAVMAAVTDRTRLAIIEHVTSPTARSLPVATLVPQLQARGIVVVVDGAQATGMLDLQLAKVGADYYVSSLHKWCCAPRGTGIVYAAAHARKRLRPLVASWADTQGFPAAFLDAGTRDLTSWLAAGRALRMLDHLDLDRLRKHNVKLAVAAQHAVARQLDIPDTRLPRGPTVSMQLVPLPSGYAATPRSAEALQAAIAEQAGVEVAITTWRGNGFARISTHAYNAPADYERLATSLPTVLASFPRGDEQAV